MPKYSVKKPMTVFVVIVIIIALGVVSLLGMTPGLMPSIDLAVCSAVMTTYRELRPRRSRLPSQNLWNRGWLRWRI